MATATGSGEFGAAWRCTVCTFDNAEPLWECEMCGLVRGATAPASFEVSCVGSILASTVACAGLEQQVGPVVHTESWSGGASHLTVLRPPGGEQKLLEHRLTGAEPRCIFSSVAGDSDVHRAAEHVAAALATYLPAQDFLPVLCRPEHVLARRSFAANPLLRPATAFTAAVAGGIAADDGSRRVYRPQDIAASIGDVLVALAHEPAPGALLHASTRDLAGGLAEPTREDAIRVRQARLKQRVSQYGLFLDTMVSDGNCLFRAIARQLYGSALPHGLVRHKVAMQIYKDRDTYLPFFGDSAEFEQYVLQMAARGTWGDELALRAVADAYGAEVHILTSAGSGCYLLYVPAVMKAGGQLPEIGSARIFLAYTYPVHYDGLVANEPTAAPEEEHVAFDGRPKEERLLAAAAACVDSGRQFGAAGSMNAAFELDME